MPLPLTFSGFLNEPFLFSPRLPQARAAVVILFYCALFRTRELDHHRLDPLDRRLLQAELGQEKQGEKQVGQDPEQATQNERAEEKDGEQQEQERSGEVHEEGKNAEQEQERNGEAHEED